ncbi:MAG: hydroxymethylbilane synthase [Nitrospira bacterium SG8_3]|nr:MAG: hydroxymethylbilane synthase [Nitrospira bacterium SG8_3]
MVLRIGTRGSKLALAQSEWVKKRIEGRHPHAQVQLVRIKTTGDKILDSPLAKIGGKGLFVKEIEEALLNKRVDLAVHSMKDVPAALPEGLILTTFPKREDPHDAFVSIDCPNLGQLPRGSRVGTGSLRRAAQLLHIRPDLELLPLRGNVDTRLRKLEAGNFQAIILAAAGMRRLGFEDRISQLLSTEQILPAIGQGALGLEVRHDDEETIGLIDFLNDEETQVTVEAERAFLKELQGGCQVPIAAFSRLNGGRLDLEGMVAELDGSKVIRDRITGARNKAEDMGIRLARRLLASGADEILERIYGKA